MISLLADENFHGAIVRGVWRREPDLDIVRVQDVGLMGSSDPEILEWAAQNGRILMTRDVETLTGYAYDRVRSGLPMPGVLEVRDRLPFRQAIEEILIFAQCSRADEWEGQVCYIPL
jgi:hypothetical protein